MSIAQRRRKAFGEMRRSIPTHSLASLCLAARRGNALSNIQRKLQLK